MFRTLLGKYSRTKTRKASDSDLQANWGHNFRGCEKIKQSKKEEKGEIIRLSVLESSCQLLLVFFPVAKSRHNVSLERMSQLTIILFSFFFFVNSTCQLLVITTIRHPQQFWVVITFLEELDHQNNILMLLTSALFADRTLPQANVYCLVLKPKIYIKSFWRYWHHDRNHLYILKYMKR